MQTRMLYLASGEDFSQLPQRSKALIGQPLAGEPTLLVVRILHFQMVHQKPYWYLWLLVEVDMFEEIEKE